MFCTHCGKRSKQGDVFCGWCGVRLNPNSVTENITPAAADPREQMLQLIERELSRYPQLVVNRSQHTDLEISSVLADAGLEKKKVEYKACLLAKSVENTVVFWEMIKEAGVGIGVFDGFKVETYGSDGRTTSGRVKEKSFGLDGKVIDYEWDYAQTRKAVEAVVKANEWSFTAVLRKGKAMN